MSDQLLTLGMVGENVAALHKALTEHGFTIPEAETKRRFFGPATRIAVGEFQKAQGINPSCEVCEKTVAALANSIAVGSAVSPDVNLPPSSTVNLDLGDTPPKTGLDRPRSDASISQASRAAKVQFDRGTKEVFLDRKQVAILTKPEVLFSRLTDLSGLPPDQANFITAKLNDHFHTEILNAIGTVNEATSMAINSAIAQLDYQKVKDANLSAVITEHVLAEVKKDEKLASVLTDLESRVAKMPSTKVSDLLNLNVALQENPIFSTELGQAKTVEYARLAGLNSDTTRKIVEKNLSFDRLGEAELSILVKDGLISDRQKTDIKLISDLGRLTKDNLPFVSTLKARNLQSIADLVSWHKADWEELITIEKIALPLGETVPTYAENILFNIERTYPSQFLLNRLLDPLSTTKFSHLDSVNSLLQTNEKLIDRNKSAAIDWQGVGAESRKRLQSELQNLTTFANTYQHLGIADLINDKAVDLAQKKAIINARLQSLDRFVKNNSNLDLRWVNFFDTKAESLNWSNISETDRPLVKKQMMAYQRSLNLARTMGDRQMLLSKGYDSALAIARKTEADFIRTSGLEFGVARTIYAGAKETALSVAHNSEVVREVVSGGFQLFNVGNIDPRLVNDLREIEGFVDLFGCQNYCDCEECKSVLSPAAYFVDLMHFIEQYVSTPAFTSNTNHPLYLKNRRSDLWQLNLTCENSTTQIPYLTIVNEVLEAYLDKVVTGDIYAQLSYQENDAQKISCSLPFNLPLTELRLYLSHFEVSLHEIYRILKQPDDKVWRAKLNLSQAEFAVITIPNPNGVKFRFDNPNSLNAFPVHDVNDPDSSKDRRGFLQLSGIKREQLDELLQLKFNPDLKHLSIVNEPTLGDIQSCNEIINNLTEVRLDFLHRFLRLWKKTTWSIPEFDLVLASMYEAKLITKDLTIPFTLNRASGSLSDRNIPVRLVPESPPISLNLPPNPTYITYLAQLVDLQEKLKLTVDELCTMVSQLPVSGFPLPPAKQSDRRLYERLFDLKKMFADPLTHAINTTFAFHHYSLNTNHPSDRTIDPNTPLLLGGLGISETELLLLADLLKAEMPFDLEGNCILDRCRISLLYRHARLAKALRFSIEDFIQVLHLNFLAPADPVVTTLEQIHQLIEFRSWLKSSPFNVSELRFILKGEESNAVKFKMNQAAVGAIVQSIPKPQSVSKITLEMIGTIIQDVQKSAQVDKVEVLKVSLSKSFNLTLDQLTEVLKSVTIDINGTQIQTALNSTFVNGIPVNPADLDTLYDLAIEIERVLRGWAITQAVNNYEAADKSPVTDKVEVLKAFLAREFNLTEIQLTELFISTTIVVNSADILTAISSTFINGIPVNPADLNALFQIIEDMDRRIEPFLKVDALKSSLTKSFNLTLNQLTDTLAWIDTDINSAQIQIALNTTFTDSVPNQPADLNALLTLAKEVERVLLLFSNLKFKEETTAYLTQESMVLGIADLKKLTLDNLKALTFYKDLIVLNDEAEPLVQAILSSYENSSPNAFSAEDITRLDELWKQDKSLIASLTNSLNLSTVPIKALKYLWECLNLCKTLGINGYSLQKLADDTDFVKLSAARDVALGAFSSKYDDEKIRTEKLEPYQDKINLKKRDALCDYVIARQELKFKDLHNLYAYFLLDVEMGDCFRISRLVCAMSSLQLYVHRILVNLEQSATSNLNVLNHIDKLEEFIQQWEWRKNYRVWEANRRVFLYPETYIEPDLRDNKTPIFKELEDELLQQKITKSSAEAAYKKYVSQFAELARLRIAGSYYHSDSNTYYFIGRTQQDPPQYYYRKWIDRKVWTPWEKIELGINAPQVSAIIHRGKLYLFWVEVIIREKSTIVNGSSFFERYDYDFSFSYSFFNENGKWITPNKIKAWFDIPIASNITSWLSEISQFEDNIKLFEDLKNNPQTIDPPSFYDELIKLAREEIIKRKNQIDEAASTQRTKIENSKSYLKCYPFSSFSKNSIQLDYVLGDEILDPINNLYTAKLDAFQNKLKSRRIPRFFSAGPGDSQEYLLNDFITISKSHSDVAQLTLAEFKNLGDAMVDVKLNSMGRNPITEIFNYFEFDPAINIVHGSFGTGFIFTCGNQDYLILDTIITKEDIAFYNSIGDLDHKRTITRLSTSKADDLGEILFNDGLQVFLSLETQNLTESPIGIQFINPSELLGPIDNTAHLVFSGAYGEYYKELFFHIPFLIANHLNANQKFKEAKWWYERVFDPTSSELPNAQNPNDRNWRYIEFRGLGIKKMKEIFTDDATIARYKDDPFNPHAIARLRLSAYQKAIVMKYIDNLIDWGDYLFAQDSIESINEATMLYILASDILGKRPAKLGKCKTVSDRQLTYNNIGPKIDQSSEFLIFLENFTLSSAVEANTSRVQAAISANSGLSAISSAPASTLDLEANTSRPQSANSGLTAISSAPASTLDIEANTSRPQSVNSGLSATSSSPGSSASIGMAASATASTPSTALSDPINFSPTPRYQVSAYTAANQAKTDYLENSKFWDQPTFVKNYPSSQFHLSTSLVFCVPPNDDLLKYWDRVEDRLFKIRNCMNISGVRRQLALFQPRIDPALLVRAKAAGLSLEDILGMQNAPLPPYRFSYLIEKAKQYTQTVQSFGSALLSALEKKDVEELTLLRSVHERNILRLTKEIKKQQIAESKSQYQAIVETKTNVQNRIDYYQGLIDEGLIPWENMQQVMQHLASATRFTESVCLIVASLVHLIPQSGSPFAMKYGGKELGDSASAIGDFWRATAQLFDSVAASAGIEASNQRREQEWNQQLLLAQQEIKQVEQQRLAAEIRQLIAKKDLEIHEKNMEQANELHDFYKDKFTSLGLYNYLSTTLNRLYREAYNVAYDMAKMAERTYEFERDDSTIFIAGDNWQFDRAGLLAGERLLLQLQRMEKGYLEKHIRDNEITQSFSLALLQPSALIDIRQTGSCDFQIPEIAFDLFYPGQYKRLIKSVRITVPCVTGPYTNVSAKLTLTKGEFRKEPRLDAPQEERLFGKNTSISTSSANNDAGVFELNFRDERYLPFEGAGAISQWKLELPSQLRQFDYNTISDIIIHLSYTAKEDGAFRNTVESQLVDTLTEFASSEGLFRLISLKHEFPSAFYQLLHSSETPQTTEFELNKQHFPYFLIDCNLTIPVSEIKLFLKNKGENPFDTSDGSLTIIPSNSAEDEAKQQKWTIDIEANNFDKEKLDDILILLKYMSQDS
jgi:Tc toxin complex TcA C-terminal TcB-binding domain/Neuraminidase-like domain/Salmonella virulence plasmid 28.1kDa A protein/Putative peptidoglycan binding domain